jgi:CDP-diacylglycerol--glycerol-3-phosphate 3-phosphatidyltransferase
MAKTFKKEFLNLPNILTLARVAVIPFFILLTYYGDPVSSYWSAVIFALAAATDVLDGWLARHKNLVTMVGKFLDPLADKLMVMAALVMLVRLGRVACVLVIVLLAREFIVTGLRTIAAAEGLVIAAGQGGKWKTSLQISGISCLLVHYTYDINMVFFRFEANFNRVGTWLLWLALIASVVSMVQYFKAFLDVMAEKDRQVEAAAAALAASEQKKKLESA